MAKTYIVAPNYATRAPPSYSTEAASHPPPPPPPAAAAPESAPSSTPGTTAAEDTDQSELIADSPALHLGDIVRDPLSSELRILNRSDRLVVPKRDLVLPVDVKTGFSKKRKDLLSGRFGIWATLLASMGLPLGGIDIGLFLERKSDGVIKASRLETHEFEATDDFVDKSMHLLSMEAYLKSCQDSPAPLYDFRSQDCLWSQSGF